jgi:hypothetical protein
MSEPAVRPSAPEGDEALSAVADVLAILERSGPATEQLLAKSRAVVRRRTDGRTWRSIAVSDERPGLVELLGDHVRALADATAILRRAQAHALYDEGVTMSEIGRLFGVSRQRVSHLLRGEQDAATDPDADV